MDRILDGVCFLAAEHQLIAYADCFEERWLQSTGHALTIMGVCVTFILLIAARPWLVHLFGSFMRRLNHQNTQPARTPAGGAIAHAHFQQWFYPPDIWPTGHVALRQGRHSATRNKKP
jgi:hypothetical protein